MAIHPAPFSAPRHTSVLESRWLYYVGVVLLTSMYWLSGLTKLADFNEAQAEMAHFGLNPPWAFAIATIVVQLAGPLLMIFSKRWAWLGAGALAVFTLLTIPIAHRFWDLEGPMAFMEKMFVFEHVTVIGGLILAAVAARLQRGD